MTARNFLVLPVGMGCVPRKDIALVGDAVHLINPFSDDGGNIALIDVMERGHRLSWCRKAKRKCGSKVFHESTESLRWCAEEVTAHY